MNDRNEEHQEQGKPQSRIGKYLEARPDEAALWTLVNGVGQLVLAGWCLSFASLGLIVGYRQLTGPGGGFPPWLNGLLSAFFIIVGAVLLYAGAQFLAQALRCVWVAWRKAWFYVRYLRRPDLTRALQSIEGDRVLEPYARHLIRRGALSGHVSETRSDG